VKLEPRCEWSIIYFMEAQEEVLVPMSKVPSYLQISLPYCYQLVKRQQIPSIKIGGKLFIRKAVLKQLQAEGTRPMKATPVISDKERS
jgi:excisionase family DNA binding protein